MGWRSRMLGPEGDRPGRPSNTAASRRRWLRRHPRARLGEHAGRPCQRAVARQQRRAPANSGGWRGQRQDELRQAMCGAPDEWGRSGLSRPVSARACHQGQGRPQAPVLQRASAAVRRHAFERDGTQHSALAASPCVPVRLAGGSSSEAHLGVTGVSGKTSRGSGVSSPSAWPGCFTRSPGASRRAPSARGSKSARRVARGRRATPASPTCRALPAGRTGSRAVAAAAGAPTRARGRGVGLPAIW